MRGCGFNIRIKNGIGGEYKNISLEEVHRISKLAKLKSKEEEASKPTSELETMLEHFNSMDKSSFREE